MPASKRRWSKEDIAELRRLAGSRSAKEIGTELGRTQAAIVLEASKLNLSLRLSQGVRAIRNSWSVKNRPSQSWTVVDRYENKKSRHTFSLSWIQLPRSIDLHLR